MKVFIFSVIRDYENCPLFICNNAYKKYEDCLNAFSEENLKLRQDKNLKGFSGGSGLSSNGKDRLYFESFYIISNIYDTIKLEMNELELH